MFRPNVRSLALILINPQVEQVRVNKDKARSLGRRVGVLLKHLVVGLNWAFGVCSAASCTLFRGLHGCQKYVSVSPVHCKPTGEDVHKGDKRQT